MTWAVSVPQNSAQYIYDENEFKIGNPVLPSIECLIPSPSSLRLRQITIEYSVIKHVLVTVTMLQTSQTRLFLRFPFGVLYKLVS